MWLSGKDKKSFWKKSKNPWSSRGFVKFTFDLSITSVEELHLKKVFGKIQKSISCQGYPWNPWGNFFQLVTVIPRGEHHLLQAVKACPLHCLAGISSLYVLKLGDQFKTKKLFGDMKNILLYKNYFGRGPPLVVILYLQSWWGKWLYDIFKALISARN